MKTKTTKYRQQLELTVCNIWREATLPVYKTLNPIDVLIGVRTLHAHTKSAFDADYDFLCDAITTAIGRVYHCDDNDPWAIHRQ